jgi:tRNA (guanine37-N1)-methyltransferase
VELLKDKLPSHLLEILPHAIDFVGKIAIIEIPLELEEFRNTVGEALLKSHRQVKTVLAKSSAVKGVYRLRKLDVIAGDHETETMHKEYGCVFQLDLAKVFFSPRLAFEHNRVALQVRKGETVVDMFTGVGPFSIPIAKRYEETQVYAIDINPDAIFYLQKNIDLNNIGKNVTPVLGDAKQVIWERYVGIADRVIMNLPEKSIEYVRAACKTLKLEGGILHFYEFGSAPNPLEKTRDRLIKTLKQNKKEVKRFLSTRIVRATSPFTWQVVADVEVC